MSIINSNGEEANRSDESLLRNVRQGDEEAATLLYQRYARRLISLSRGKISAEFASRFDADDIVQSVFRSFFRKAKEGFYQVPASGELWHLLLVLSLNKIRSQAVYHRAQKRDVRASVQFPDEDRPHDDRMALEVLQAVVEDSIDELPPKQRQIVRDRIDGYEIAEIADRSGRSKRTVERTLQTFRQSLSKKIDDDE